MCARHCRCLAERTSHVKRCRAPLTIDSSSQVAAYRISFACLERKQGEVPGLLDTRHCFQSSHYVNSTFCFCLIQFGYSLRNNSHMLIGRASINLLLQHAHEKSPLVLERRLAELAFRTARSRLDDFESRFPHSSICALRVSVSQESHIVHAINTQARPRKNTHNVHFLQNF